MSKKKVARAPSAPKVTSGDEAIEAEFFRFADEMTADIAIARAARLARLPEADRELLMRIEGLEGYARSVRDLIEHPESFTPFRDGAELLSARKREALAALRRMDSARMGAAPDDGAPYVAARLRFVDGVIFHARIERAEPAADGGVARAFRLALRIAELYPSLAVRLNEAHRVQAIRAAILVKATRKTIPWEQIAAAWDGIEPWANTTESWRDMWRKRGE